MYKILIFTVVLVCTSCNRNRNKAESIESIKEIKYFNLDSNMEITSEKAENYFCYKLFPNGDTNFIYFFKDNLANDLVAWDTNGKKTLENNIGILKKYNNNFLSNETFFNGNIKNYKIIDYFKSGSIKRYIEFIDFKPKMIIDYNENGDTINFEEPNN